eukprot:4099200-Pyramimonas_sp.AAC.1
MMCAFSPFRSYVPLRPVVGPTMPQQRPKRGPKSSQDGTKSAQERTQRPENAPRGKTTPLLS